MSKALTVSIFVFYIAATGCSETNKLIKQRAVKAGMTQAQCVRSWGKPDDIRHMGTAYPIDVYSYSGRILIFKNGILTKIVD